jgi:hypothetical protein
MKEVQKGEKNSYYWALLEKIEALYRVLDTSFKQDPLYNLIIKYFIDFSQAKRKNKSLAVPQMIQFYEGIYYG